MKSYTGNAHIWGGNLNRAGYKSTAYPVAGDTVVFQPNFRNSAGEYAVNRSAGHIAVVMGYSNNYNATTKIGTRTLAHRGANTGGLETEGGCSKVKTSTVTYNENGGTGYIAYYHK